MTGSHTVKGPLSKAIVMSVFAVNTEVHSQMCGTIKQLIIHQTPTMIIAVRCISMSSPSTHWQFIFIVGNEDARSLALLLSLSLLHIHTHGRVILLGFPCVLMLFAARFIRLRVSRTVCYGLTDVFLWYVPILVMIHRFNFIGFFG